MGIGCGTAVVGSLGTATQRRLSIIGSCYTRALTLQRLSATLEASLRGLFSPTEAPTCYECIIDEPTRSECPENCPNVCVGTVPRQGKASAGLVTVSQDPTPTEKQSVYGVVFNDEPEPDSKAYDEWMYEMDGLHHANPFRYVNEAMESALKPSGGASAAIPAAKHRLAQLNQDAQQRGSARASAMAGILALVMEQLEHPAMTPNGAQQLLGLLSQFTVKRQGDAINETTPVIEMSENTNHMNNSELQLVARADVAELATWLRIVQLSLPPVKSFANEFASNANFL
eukprot:GILJ01032955.1.p1 GENE.GILJ01032955.1~~GILJ01032955.1.p1  ORF type:complete len:286 (+),score=42.00 GILJ01032955.1:253-1110(+)